MLRIMLFSHEIKYNFYYCTNENVSVIKNKKYKKIILKKEKKSFIMLTKSKLIITHCFVKRQRKLTKRN